MYKTQSSKHGWNGVALSLVLALLVGCGKDAPVRLGPGSSVGAIEGRLIAPGSASIPATLVSLGSNAAHASVVQTDSEGRFRFTELTAGEYALSFVPPAGYAPAEGAAARNVSVSNGGVTEVDLQLAGVDTIWVPPGQVGKLRVHARAEGAGVPNVSLVAFADDGAAIAYGATDPNGDAEMWVPIGHCSLRAEEPPRFHLQSIDPEQLVVAEGGIVDVNVELTTLPPPSTGDLTVQVVGAAASDSLGIAQVPVRVLRTGSGEAVVSGATGTGGIVTWSLPAGHYDAEIDVPQGYHLLEGRPNPIRDVEVRLGESSGASFYLVRN